jgi:hypothetical protein
MSRNLLHKTKLEPFKAWLSAKGIQHRPPRGDYDVLQVLSLDRGLHQWMCLFDRHHAPEHYTVDERMAPLVRRFIKETKVAS